MCLWVYHKRQLCAKCSNKMTSQSWRGLPFRKFVFIVVLAYKKGVEGVCIILIWELNSMPRTSYSDFSLPNIDQEFEQWPRGVTKRKLLIHKKKSRNICRPNRKKSKRQQRKLQARFTYKRTHSPDYRIQIYEEDSASFQSDCLDRRSREGHETEIALEKE